MAKTVRIPIEMGNERKLIVLSKKEYALFTLLKEHKGQLVLLSTIWTEISSDANYVRVTKKALQEKIKDYYEIESLYGVGYIIRELSVQL